MCVYVCGCLVGAVSLSWCCFTTTAVVRHISRYTVEDLWPLFDELMRFTIFTKFLTKTINAIDVIFFIKTYINIYFDYMYINTASS